MVERPRKVPQRIVDETDGAQRLGSRHLVTDGLEARKRLDEEVERRAMVEQQFRASPLLVQGLGVCGTIGQIGCKDRRLQRVVQRPARVDIGNAVGRRKQQRQPLPRFALGFELGQDFVDRRHVQFRVTHARPRPGSRRTLLRGPGR